MRFDNVMIQMVRKHVPSLIVQDIIGVQPMDGNILKDLMNIEITNDERIPQQGERCHDFIRGLLIYYGTQWISNELYFRIKIKGL